MYTFTFIHLADAFIQSNLQMSINTILIALISSTKCGYFTLRNRHCYYVL